jgi:hypothetical protein
MEPITSLLSSAVQTKKCQHACPPLSLQVTSSQRCGIIVSSGDAGAEEEDHRLKNKLLARFKFSSLLFGLLLGFFVQLMIIETKMLLLTFWDEHHATKSQTNIVGFSLFWSFFAAATIIASLGFLRKLVTSTYSAARGRSKDLLEDIVLHVEYCFGVGTFLAWTIGTVAGIIWGMPTECAFLMLAIVLLWYKIEMMCSATDSNLLSSYRSTAEETMTAV